MLSIARTCAVLSILGIVVLAGCARSPEAEKARHLGRADRYFGREQFREAVIEYANVLRIEGSHPHAVRQLALAHYHLGELGRAFPYLLKSRESDPGNLDVRLKLGTIYLMARRPADARREVALVLRKEPKNAEALLVWAQTAGTPQEIDAAIERLEEARTESGSPAKLHMALAALYLRTHDAAKAERALLDAVATEPTSSRARLTLAEFYLSFQKPEEGKRILAEITTKTPEFLPAWLRRAEVALAERKYDESLKALDVVFKESPSHLEGLLLSGRARLGKGATSAAIDELQRVVKLEPGLAQAHYHLARAYVQAGNLLQARAELNEATTRDPAFIDATLLEAEIQIQTGAYQPAIEALERLIARRPHEVRAHVLLGSAYLGNWQPVKATDAYRRIVVLTPQDPRGPHLVGAALSVQGKKAEAAQQFEAALALAPEFVEPLTYLVVMALADRKADAALERVKLQVARVPASGRLRHLLGTVYAARGETKPAEAAFLKALELEPTLVGAHLSLGQLYTASGNYDEALAKLHAALRVNPKNLVAHMRVGMLLERRGDFTKAQQAYEQVLALDPRFAPAANNLAYLYSSSAQDKEKALQLAQIAKEVSPEDPFVSDTLGWIFYKRGVYQRALGLLKESAAKLPENPEVQYHFGMASYKAGDKASARKALAKAVASAGGFGGRDEARKVLAELDATYR